LGRSLARQKQEFSRICNILYQRGLVSGVGGNLCARVGDYYLLTPTGYSLRDVNPYNVSVLDKHLELIQGPSPTKDAFVHLEVLNVREDVTVSCHIHGPHATAVSSLLQPGDNSLPPITPGFVYFAYPLPLLRFMLPGSDELKRSVLKAFSNKGLKAVLLQNHGLITLGETYYEAVDIAEEIEEAAHIYLLTRGKARGLTDEQINSIKGLREA